MSRIIRQIGIGMIVGLAFGGLGTAGVATFRPPGLPQALQAKMAAIMAPSPARPPTTDVRPAAPVSTPLPFAQPGPANGPAQAITGPARLVDTATLAVGDRMLSLAGVAQVDRQEARQAASDYLAARGGTVECQPVMDRWRCLIGPARQDVAEVLALSGLAVAAADAPHAIREAEADARRGKRGIWSTF